MQREYWARIHNRAFHASCRALGLVSRQQIVIRAAIAIAVLMGLLFLGSDGAAQDEIVARAFGVGVVILLFPMIYAWNFVASPAHIDMEAREVSRGLAAKLAESERALTAKRDRRTSTLLLSILVERANEYLVERITEEQVPMWLSKVGVWEILTVKALATFFSHQDAVSFKNVKYTTQANFIFKANEEHNNKLRQMAVRLDTLRTILDRYKDDWSTISKDERNGALAILAALESQIVAPDSS